jgi:hypothetical protein
MQLSLRTASDVPTSSIAGKKQFTKSATQLIRPVVKVCWSKFLQSLIETKRVCLRLQITSPPTGLWIFSVLRMNSRWIETQFCVRKLNYHEICNGCYSGVKLHFVRLHRSLHFPSWTSVDDWIRTYYSVSCNRQVPLTIDLVSSSINNLQFYSITRGLRLRNPSYAFSSHIRPSVTKYGALCYLYSMTRADAPHKQIASGLIIEPWKEAFLLTANSVKKSKVEPFT